MLHWNWELFDDPATVESGLMGPLLRESPELPEWSAAVQPVLTRLLTTNHHSSSRYMTLWYLPPMLKPTHRAQSPTKTGDECVRQGRVGAPLGFFNDLKSWTEPAPLIGRFAAPGPTIVKLWRIGNVLFRVMVLPLRQMEKVISSVFKAWRTA